MSIVDQERSAASTSPHLGLVAWGVALMVLIPPVLWSPALAYGLARHVGSALGLVPTLVGVALFAGGWVVVGAGVRPRQSGWRGAAGAAVLYLLIGLAWVVARILIGPTQVLLDPRTLLFVPLWPWHVAFIFGFFGLGPQ